MLIPFGFLAASGVAPGTYELIATAFGTGSSGTITFTSIPQDYKQLQIRLTAKSDTTEDIIKITMNGITSGVYIRHSMRATGNGVTSLATTPSQTSISLASIMSASTTAKAFGAGVIDILDYASTTKNTTVRGLYGFTDSTNRVSVGSGLYNQTTAVSSLTLTAPTGNFTSSSRFSLYGIRG